MRELHFLEIRIDPQIVQRHDRQQRLSGCDATADLHTALRDVTARRRDDRVAMRIDPRLAKRGARLLNRRISRDVVSIDERMRCCRLPLCGFEPGLRIRHRLPRVRHIFRRDGAFGE